jgi:osmotically-inducible protein OsmY
MTSMTVAVTKSDSQLKSDVLAELRWDPRVRETEVGVQVRGGTVTLTGSIDSYAAKLAAREAAHRVLGVLDVADELRVRLPSAWERGDPDVAKGVRDALRQDVTVPDDRITTTVSEGVVTLEGEVDLWSQRADAERAIERLSGVKGVINRIAIAPKAVDAAFVKRQIEEALERQAEREARRIGVSISDGVVTLTGTVRSWAERNAIDRVAGYAQGVRRVDDRLTVDPYS